MKRLAIALLVLCLAPPMTAATFTVDSTGDEPDANTGDNVCQTAGGFCTLRAAMEQANASAGADTIAFNIPGAGVHTISPATELPNIGGELTIDGYTQPGSSPNTNAAGALDTVLQIEIEGGSAPQGTRGLTGAGPVSIRGLVLNRFQYDITFSGLTAFHEVRGCFIGTDASGTVALPGAGSSPGAGTGIDFASGVREVIGNLVGTDVTGMLAIPNGVGIAFLGSAAGTISNNVVSGNSTFGILFNSNTIIQGNRIGTTADGSGPLGNGLDGLWNGGGNNVIGGVGPGEANVIAYSGRWGYVNGQAGNGGPNNPIRGNSIHDNGWLGIDLGADDVTANDPGDADSGSNNLQNFPILQSVEHSGPQGSGTTRIVGKLDSAASTTYDLDFYSNSVCSNFPRDFVEGEIWLGTAQVTTDGSGHADFDVTLPIGTEVGARITATATDPAGNTSEFSQRIVFSILPVSGPDAGGTPVTIKGTDFADGSTVTIGGVAPSGASVDDSTTITGSSPALAPGTSNDVVVTTPDGTTGTLVKGWVADFLDVPQAHIFHSFVVTLVSNGITVGVGGGNYGVTQDTLRQQMAVFLLRSKYGLCFVPPPCAVQVFDDVPCSLIFAPWINELVAQGITGGCAGGNNYCPTNPVLRQQMAVLLLRTLEGTGYAPPACTVESFTDVPCSSPFAAWIYELVARNITAGCGGGLYCPTLAANRGQMATFLVKTFNLQ